MLSGIVMGGVALIGLSSMNSLWQFYLFYLFNALGYMCGGPLPNQVLVSRWFTKSRGKAMGIIYLGIGIGGMLVPQVARSLTASFGWRDALMILGLLMVAVAFPMAWFVKEHPDNTTVKVKQGDTKVQFGNILKSWPFYLLAIGSMCSIGAVAGTTQNIKLFLSIDLKYSQENAANVLSIILAASIIGRLLMGWLADRIQKKYVMILIYSLVALSIPLLYFSETARCDLSLCLYFWCGAGG